MANHSKRPENPREPGDDELAKFDETDDSRNNELVPTRRSILGWVGFLLFRAPGKALNWIAYMFPTHGDVLSSRRRYGNPKAEIVQSLQLWLIIGFILFWVIVGYYQLKGRYGW